MISPLVCDAEYVGAVDNLAATADRMAARGLLTRADLGRLRLLEAFGILIANTDRHYSNISLLLADDDWTLTPCYGMLPMLYAPISGELVARDFTARKPAAHRSHPARMATGASPGPPVLASRRERGADFKRFPGYCRRQLGASCRSIGARSALTVKQRMWRG